MDEKENRTILVRCLLKPSELAIWSEICENKGITISQLIRDSVRLYGDNYQAIEERNQISNALTYIYSKKPDYQKYFD